MSAEPTIQPSHASPAGTAAALALGSADLLQLSYQAVALGGAGLQLLFSREPMSLRRAAETLILWQLIVDLGHTVMNSKFSVQRDGLKWSLVSGIGGAGLLGIWANSLARRSRTGRGRRAASPLDLDVAGMGLSQDTLDAIAQRSARLLEQVAGIGAEVASFGGMFFSAPRDPAAARRAGQEQRMPEQRPSATQALTPAIHAGLLALYAMSKRGTKSR